MGKSSYSWRHCVNSVEQALFALKDNRLRTLLSILGIAIGIAAVMAVGSISKGGRHLIFSELETFGLKSVWIWRTDDEKDPNRTIRKGTGIDIADLQAINTECCPAVSRVTPLVHASGSNFIIRAGNQFSNGKIIGVNLNYFPINNDKISLGYGFKTDDVVHRRHVVVIGKNIAIDLFGHAADVFGKEMRLGEKKYTIVGLLEPKSRDFLASIGSAGEDSNNRILVPYTTLQLQLGHKEIHSLQAEAIEYGLADAAAHQIIQVLLHQHNKRFRYRSESMATYIETANRILQGVSLIGIIAAAVSLLVGGMGIMNIISISVLERTREIGLRKAVGATSKLIRIQFLMESVIISGVGGGIGLLIGTLASNVLSWVTGFPLIPSWLTVLVALFVSIVVGLISGFYPAQRAAKLKPVVALRYE